MASSKDTFESKTFASNTFACGTFRGLGVTVDVVATGATSILEQIWVSALGPDELWVFALGPDEIYFNS